MPRSLQLEGARHKPKPLLSLGGLQSLRECYTTLHA